MGLLSARPSASVTTPENPHRMDEGAKINLWRFEGFISLGIEDTDALRLADSKCELEYARKLHRAGCPAALIVRIIDGTHWADLPPLEVKEYNRASGW